MNIEDAYAYCKKVTRAHYENFPVASFLLPGHIRNHVYAIYAFARHADDLSDEFQDRPGLLEWRDQFHRALSGPAEHPILVALTHTIRTFHLPVALFDDLLSAFLQDLDKNRYENFPELMDYCRRSANPVGRLVLLLHGYRDPGIFEYSDSICTALQLTNFWQDVKIDILKDRIYIPNSYLKEYEISNEAIRELQYSKAFRQMLMVLINETQRLFDAGLPLLASLKRRLRWELTLTILGGRRILQKISELDCDVLNHRPTLSSWDGVNLLIYTFMRKDRIDAIANP